MTTSILPEDTAIEIGEASAFSVDNDMEVTGTVKSTGGIILTEANSVATEDVPETVIAAVGTTIAGYLKFTLEDGSVAYLPYYTE